MVDAYPVPQAQPVVYTTESDMRRLLGMPVTFYEVKSALQRLDFDVKRVSTVDAKAPAEATLPLHKARMSRCWSVAHPGTGWMCASRQIWRKWRASSAMSMWACPS